MSKARSSNGEMDSQLLGEEHNDNDNDTMTHYEFCSVRLVPPG